MEKSYFFIRKADSEAVEKIFRNVGIKPCLCPCCNEPETLLVSFYSTPTEQKFLLSRLAENNVEYTCL